MPQETTTILLRLLFNRLGSFIAGLGDGTEDVVRLVVSGTGTMLRLMSLVGNTLPMTIARRIAKRPMHGNARLRLLEPLPSTTYACATCPISPTID